MMKKLTNLFYNEDKVQNIKIKNKKKIGEKTEPALHVLEENRKPFPQP